MQFLLSCKQRKYTYPHITEFLDISLMQEVDSNTCVNVSFMHILCMLAVEILFCVPQNVLDRELCMATKLVCLLISSYLLLAGHYHVVSGFTPVTYSSKSSSTECGQSDPLQDDQLMAVINQVRQRLNPPGCNPPRNRSCQEILHCFPSAPSGYHEIHVPNGSLVQVYCDMEGTNCGGQGGWMRVTNVNMSQSGASCPQGLTQKNMSGLTLCGQSATGCQGTLFSALGLSYSRVCGQLRGYQFSTPNAFSPYNKDNNL